MKYNKKKFDMLVDMLLDNNGSVEVRKAAVKELVTKPLMQSTIDKITLHETLYGSIPDDLHGIVAEKKKQRLEDTATMIEDVEKNLGVQHLSDFCLYLGIPEDASSSDIMDKAHVVVRNGRMKQPRSVVIAS